MKNICYIIISLLVLNLGHGFADHTAQGVSREIAAMFDQFGGAAGADLLLLAQYADQVRELEHLESAVDGLTKAYQGKLVGFVAVSGEQPYISAGESGLYDISSVLRDSSAIPVGQAALEVVNDKEWVLVTKVGNPNDGECVLGVLFSPQQLIQNTVVLDENAACRLVFGGAGTSKVWTMDLGSAKAAQMLATVPEEQGPYIDELAFDVFHAQNLKETIHFLNWDFEISIALVQAYRERIPGQLTGRWMGACSLNDGEDSVGNQAPSRGRTMEAVILQKGEKIEFKMRYEDEVSGFLGSRKGMDITAWPDGLVEGDNSGFCRATYMPAKKALKGVDPAVLKTLEK